MIACCCGCPAYFGKPMWDQYPASATLPTDLTGLKLRDDATSKQTVQQLKADMRMTNWLAEGTFAGVYADSRGKTVTIFGVTGFRFSPDQDLDTEFTRLTGQYGLTDIRDYDTGVRGEHQRCGTGRAEGATVVACTWADHGSIGTALFTKLSLEDSAERLPDLRDGIVSRNWN
ncbi:hypothetical protein GCM10027280_47240 [Micromonospora polyrhachis]